MPILDREDDIFPRNLLDVGFLDSNPERAWYCLYTKPRREKELMRRLAAMKVPHYGPMIPKRFRSPNGRLRTSYIPLFANYVFMFADDQDRHNAMKTNCIAQSSKVEDPEMFLSDIRQIFNVIDAGVALTPEARLEAGDRVRVKSGPFAGYEGNVLRREGKTRFLLSIQYLEQGVSMEMDEGLLEVI